MTPCGAAPRCRRYCRYWVRRLAAVRASGGHPLIGRRGPSEPHDSASTMSATCCSAPRCVGRRNPRARPHLIPAEPSRPSRRPRAPCAPCRTAALASTALLPGCCDSSSTARYLGQRGTKAGIPAAKISGQPCFRRSNPRAHWGHQGPRTGSDRRMTLRRAGARAAGRADSLRGRMVNMVAGLLLFQGKRVEAVRHLSKRHSCSFARGAASVSSVMRGWPPALGVPSDAPVSPLKPRNTPRRHSTGAHCSCAMR